MCLQHIFPHYIFLRLSLVSHLSFRETKNVRKNASNGIVVAIKGIEMYLLSVPDFLTTNVGCAAWNLSILVLIYLLNLKLDKVKDIKLTVENSVQGETKRPQRDFSLALPK